MFYSASWAERNAANRDGFDCRDLNIAFLSTVGPPLLVAQSKLVIESPANSQHFTSGQVVVVVKVDPSVRKVRAAVTVPVAGGRKAPANREAGEPGGDSTTKTVFDLRPVELARGAERWSPEIRLAKGENAIFDQRC